MIVLDASVLIAHLDGTDIHHDRAGLLLVEAVDESLGASPLTLAEVLVGPARRGDLDAARAALVDLEVDPLELPADAPARLATLRVETGLRLPDCCVVLAAQSADAEIATFDERLGRSATDRGISVRR